MKVVGLSEKRAVKANDARLWTPLESLKALVRDIENKEFPMPDQLIIHMLTFEKDGSERWTHHFQAAGVSSRDHLALLEIAKHNLLEDIWR